MSKKKKEQLGMPYGTAAGRLRKKILFSLVKEAGLNRCYQCNEEIKKETNFSIEHKIPWLDSKKPVEVFFDLNNIAFSHCSCNSATRRDKKPGPIKHGTHWAYGGRGCRCEICKEFKSKADKRYKMEGKSDKRADLVLKTKGS